MRLRRAIGLKKSTLSRRSRFFIRDFWPTRVSFQQIAMAMHVLHGGTVPVNWSDKLE
jgi:hypothetical protein